MKRFYRSLSVFLIALAVVFACCSCAEKQVEIERITLNVTTKTLVSGESYQLVAKAYPENASQEFTWTSSNTSYVTVSETGLIKGKNTGNDTSSGIKVTATSKSDPTKKKACTIYVEVAPPATFTVSKTGMLTAGPGQDASTSAVISWHAATPDSVLEYTTYEDTGYAAKTTQECPGTISTADFADTATHYRCRVVLTGLTPDTSYRYRIVNGTSTTQEGYFRTAGSDTTFQFMWLSDLHTPKGSSSYVSRVSELINFANAKDGVDLDFCLFTGDMVNKGQIYKHWNYWSDSGLMRNMTYAFLSGNHDYYPYGTKDRNSNAYFKDVAAYPYNNTQASTAVLDSNYWFIWNRVMFVCVDNFTSEGATTRTQSGSSVSAQVAWVRAVVNANAGNFDYLVYAQHLPFFINDEPCSYGQYSDWRALFDELKVDFALSSDEHAYTRTKPLKNNAAVALTDGKVTDGTVYVTSFETEGSKVDTPTNKASASAKYAAYYGGGGVAGVYFTVTPEEMTLHLIGANGTEYDTVTVPKKTR